MAVGEIHMNTNELFDKYVKEGTERIKEFWDNQAKVFGASDIATAPDSAYRELEIQSIIPHITGQHILDAGCGNGFSTFRFQQAYPDKLFVGIDYSMKMINEAIAENIHRHLEILFFCQDVRLLGMHLTTRYDTIISERCLINLKTWDEQKQALLEMKKCLEPDGRIILAENFIDGLNNLNALRKQFGLHTIEVRWHNRYLVNEEFIPFINEHFTTEYHSNIGNLYYLISRVVYAALCKEIGQEPQYDNPINYIAAKLPSLGTYGYSPNMLFVLRAK